MPRYNKIEEDLWMDWGNNKLQCEECGLWFYPNDGECNYCGRVYTSGGEQEFIPNDEDLNFL